MRNFQNDEVITGVSKNRQNKLAMELATRSRNRIEYDSKNPLIVDEKNKVMEMYVIRDEEEEKSDLDQEKYVRVVFQDKEEDAKDSLFGSEPYAIDIHTYLSLSAFEKALARCNSEEEIESLDE